MTDTKSNEPGVAQVKVELPADVAVSKPDWFMKLMTRFAALAVVSFVTVVLVVVARWIAHVTAVWPLP